MFNHSVFYQSVKYLFSFVFLLSFFQVSAPAADRLPKRCRLSLEKIKAERETKDPLRRRWMRLSNGLSVLMFSDPSATLSAVAMAIKNGGLQDPQGREGTFHFLEHMVFIGSKEFPEVDGLAKYVKENGGTYNGLTGHYYTIYPIDIKPDKFDGALARLAALFRHPLIEERYVKKELNAVHQEYENNISSDPRRMFHIYKILVGQDHPLGRYFQGNLESLKDVTSSDLRELFDMYYVTGNMQLVLAGPQSLEELEQLARVHFGSLPQRPSLKISYPPLKENVSEAIPVAKIRSLRERVLSVTMRMPHDSSEIYQSSAGLLAAAISRREPGSFADFLSNKGWIEKISADYSQQQYSDEMDISFSLSNSGVENWQQILAYTKMFLTQLSDSSLGQSFIDSLVAIQTNHYVNQRNSLNFGFVLNQALQTMKGPLPFTLEVGQFPIDPSVERIQKKAKEILDLNRWAILLSYPDYKGHTTTRYYGIEYTIQQVPRAELFASSPMPQIFVLPGANKYLASDYQPLETSDPVKEFPLKDGVQLQYYPESRFKQSKIFWELELFAAKPKNTHEFVAQQMAKLILVESLAIDIEKASEAFYGVDINGSASNRYSSSGLLDLLFSGNRINLEVFGLREKFQFLLKDLSLSLSTLSVTPDRYEVLKEVYLDQVHRLGQTDAVTQARWEKYLRLFGQGMDREQFLEIAKKISFADAQQSAFEWLRFSKGNVFAHGELTNKEAEQWSQDFLQKIKNSSPHEGSGRVLYPYLKQGEVTRYEMKSQTNSGVVRLEYEMGDLTHFDRWAATKIFANFVGPEFFRELRTEQQWGYGVGSADIVNSHVVSLLFLIQTTKNLDQVEQAMFAWINGQALQSFSNLSDEAFANLQKAVAYNLERDPSTINESVAKRGVWFSLGLAQSAKEQLLAQVKSLTKKQVEEIMRSALVEKTNGLRIIRVNHD